MSENIDKVRANDLMKPRYEVVIFYPCSPYSVGDIITLDKISDGWDKIPYAEYPPMHWEEEDLKQYPAIFKPLQWWQHRKVEEMPEYLAYAETGEVIKVTNYEFWNNGCWYYQGREFKPSGYFGVDGAIPATIEDYEQFK